MSNDIVLKPHIFLNNVSVTATSSWVPIDFKYSGAQNRSISGFRADSNSPVKLLTKTVVKNFNRDGVEVTATEVTATATTWDVSGRNYFSSGIVLPATHVRVIKTNASGAATVVGII
jgi:hypothetical protein